LGVGRSRNLRGGEGQREAIGGEEEEWTQCVLGEETRGREGAREGGEEEEER
jgi:hypothetical protein